MYAAKYWTRFIMKRFRKCLIRKCLKIWGTEIWGEERKKKETHPRSNFGHFQILIKTSIFEIWHPDFRNTFVCAYSIDRSNKKKYLCMKTKDDENGQLDSGINSSPAAAGFLCKVGSAIAWNVIINLEHVCDEGAIKMC